jgi:hypothetical protein
MKKIYERHKATAWDKALHILFQLFFSKEVDKKEK